MMDSNKKRSACVARVNGSLANMEIAQARLTAAHEAHEKLLNKARSEIGTAKSLLNKATREYMTARDQLLLLVPEVPAEAVSAVELAEELEAAE